MTAGIFGNEFAFRDKMGFGIPLKQFFSDSNFTEYLNEVVSPGVNRRGILNHSLFSKWLAKLSTLSYHEMEALWIAITFEIWAKTYLDLENENWDTLY